MLAANFQSSFPLADFPMLIIFKSRATADVITFEKIGKKLLDVAGKDAEQPKGIFTLEQLPEAISRLKQAAEVDLAEARARRTELDRDPDKTKLKADVENVCLFQRAMPLIEMMETSLKEKQVVTWGV